MQGEALARVSLLAVALSLWALPRAAAQVDPEIPDTECVVTLGLDDGDPVRLDEFNLGQQILVRDEAGCAPPNVTVEAALRGGPDDYELGETTSEDDGGFVIRANIPSEAEFGTHLLVVDAGRERYTKAIQIVPRSAGKPVDRARVAAIAGAALLIVLGVAVAVVPSRARRRTRRALSSSPKEGDVPFIDTSGFVPLIELPDVANNSRTTAPKRKAQKSSRSAGWKDVSIKPAPKEDRSPDVSKAADDATETTPPTD